MTFALRPQWLIRLVLAFTIVGLFLPSGHAALTFDGSEADTLRPGTVTQVANGSTVVGVQGFHFEGEGDQKKPARLVSADERAETEWVHNGTDEGATWFYDQDPLPNGNVLVVSTAPDKTFVYEFDPETQTREWVEEFDIEDTHDVVMLNEHELAVANMRNWDAETQTSNDRLFVYNRTREEITWEWYFKDHYPDDTDGGMNDDWTHVNDLEPVGDDQLLVSVRNFDQVLLINMTTSEVDLRLGSDDDHEVLHEQHNPDWLEGEDGTPTILVADSESHRVVEYELVECDGEAADGLPECEWERTWGVGGGQLTWPRDADRLPNGNTLITDTLNHRVIEVTPTGEIVWEYYATWGPYDAERVAHGGGSNGPTIRDMDAEGSYELSGSAGLDPGEPGHESFDTWLSRQAAGSTFEGPVQEFAILWRHLTPWVRPAWLDSWGFIGALTGGFLGVCWGFGEVVAARHRIINGVRSRW